MSDERPTHLDLFSGIGGFALAAGWAGFRTIAFCEIDKYCQKVLAKNFLADSDGGQRFESKRSLQAGSHPRIFGDIFDLDGTQFRRNGSSVTLVTGGFPCQPFSVAGKRRGAADDRHLWPEMLRVIKEGRPAWVLGENVPGIIPMELDNVLSDMESIGYACQPFVIPACAVDARHRRDRLWIVGRNVSDARCERDGTHQSKSESGRSQEANNRALCETVADSEKFTERESTNEAYAFAIKGRTWNEPRNSGSIANTNGQSQRRPAISRSEYCEWLPEPDVGRVAHGIPKRVDRLKGLGNAIVPQVAHEILREIRLMIT